MTKSKYIRNFAREARKIFVANNWKFNTVKGKHYKVPSAREIVDVIRELENELNNNPDWHVVQTRRIVMVREDIEGALIPFTLALELTPAYGA